MTHRLVSVGIAVASLLIGLPFDRTAAASPSDSVTVDIEATQTAQAGQAKTRKVEHYLLSLNGRGDWGKIDAGSAGNEKTHLSLRIVPEGGPSLGFNISRDGDNHMHCSMVGEIALPAPGGKATLGRIACADGELEFVLIMPKK